MALTPDQQVAAKEFANATIEELRTERGVHIETAIAATARMAGTFLFRSFNFTLPDAKPGQPVLSEQANEKGPRLIQVLGEALDLAEIEVDLNALNESPGSEHEPHLSFLQTQKVLEPLYDAIRTRLGLSLDDSADSAAEATASLIIQGAGVLQASIAFNIALYGFVEGSKTIPADI